MNTQLVDWVRAENENRETRFFLFKTNLRAKRFFMGFGAVYLIYTEPALHGAQKRPTLSAEQKEKPIWTRVPGIYILKNEVGKTTCHYIPYLVSPKSCLFLPLFEPTHQSAVGPTDSSSKDGTVAYSNRIRTGRDFFSILFFLIFFIQFYFYFIFFFVCRYFVVKVLFWNQKCDQQTLQRCLKNFYFLLLCSFVTLSKLLNKAFPPNISRIWLIYGHPRRDQSTSGDHYKTISTEIRWLCDILVYRDDWKTHCRAAP